MTSGSPTMSRTGALRVSWPGSYTLTGQKFRLGLAGAVALRTYVFLIVMLMLLRSLLLAMLQQFAECLPNCGIGVICEDNTPTSFSQILWVDAFLSPVAGLSILLMSPFQLFNMPLIDRLAASNFGDILRRHRSQQIIPANTVDAVEN